MVGCVWWVAAGTAARFADTGAIVDCWDAPRVSPGSHVPGIDAGGRSRVLFLGSGTIGRILRLGGGTRRVLILTTMLPDIAAAFPFFLVRSDIYRTFAGGHLQNGRYLCGSSGHASLRVA